MATGVKKKSQYRHETVKGSGIYDIYHFETEADIVEESTSRVFISPAQKNTILGINLATCVAYKLNSHGGVFPSPGYQIILPPTLNIVSSTMVTLTVRMFLGYKYTDVRFSGYAYNNASSNFNWYLPAALIVSTTHTEGIQFVMGKLTDGRLYVWVPGSTWGGVAVMDVSNLYQGNKDVITGWEINQLFFDDLDPTLIAYNKVVFPATDASTIVSGTLDSKRLDNNLVTAGNNVIVTRNSDGNFVINSTGGGGAGEMPRVILIRKKLLANNDNTLFDLYGRVIGEYNPNTDRIAIFRYTKVLNKNRLDYQTIKKRKYTHPPDLYLPKLFNNPVIDGGEGWTYELPSEWLIPVAKNSGDVASKDVLLYTINQIQLFTNTRVPNRSRKSSIGFAVIRNQNGKRLIGPMTHAWLYRVIDPNNEFANDKLSIIPK